MLRDSIRDRLVKVLGLDDIVAAKLLLGFGEGTVGGKRLGIAHPDGRRGAGRLERVAGLELAVFDDALGKAMYS
jgi:hypothetical protein